MATLLDPQTIDFLLSRDAGPQLGGVQVSIAETAIFVVAVLTALLSASGILRIGRAEDRQARLADIHHSVAVADTEQDEQPPGLPWYSRLGASLMKSPIVSLGDPRRVSAALAEAGIAGNHQNVGVFLACKLALGIILAGLAWWWTETELSLFDALPLLRWCVRIGGLGLGIYLPEVVIRRLAERRKTRLEHSIPDALDLLVICSESGLALQPAIEEVSHALHQADPEIAKEFGITAAEMNVLPNRSTALENLAKRTGVPSLRSLISTLNQSMRFGTSLAESVRMLAGEMRNLRISRIEERAARLPVLLSVPLMLFLMPALLIVIMSPVALRIADLVSNMNSGH